MGGRVRARRDQAGRLLPQAVPCRVQAGGGRLGRHRTAQAPAGAPDAVRDAAVPPGGERAGRPAGGRGRGRRRRGEHGHPARQRLRARGGPVLGRAVLRRDQQPARDSPGPGRDPRRRVRRPARHDRLDGDVPHQPVDLDRGRVTVTRMQEEPGLTESERAELSRLRAENAALRAQGQAAAAAPRPPRPGGRQRWRSIVAVLLIVLGCVLAPLAGVAVWARNQVTNSDRYVTTVTPLASDPAIQQAITDQITAQVFTYVDVQALTTQVVDALSARVEGRGLPPQTAAALQGLAGPVANGVQGFVRTQVERIVQSQAFEDAWVQANRAAHEALVKALTGEGGGSVTIENDAVTLNLAPFRALTNAS